MSAHMKEIQAALPADQPIRLVSFTTDPAFDQPPVLKKYGERFEARDGCWTFLTGDKAALHNAEVNGLKLAVIDKAAGQQEPAPTTSLSTAKNLFCSTKQGRIRG